MLVYPVNYVESVRVPAGSTLPLICKATSFPLAPATTLSYMGSIVNTQPNRTNHTSVAQKNLVITDELTGRYQCTAESNYFDYIDGGYVTIKTRKYIDVEIYGKLRYACLQSFIHH